MDCLDKLQKLAKDGIGIAAHAIIDEVRYAKMPHHLMKYKKKGFLENGTYEPTFTHLERELELNGLEVSDELQSNTLSQYATKNSEKPQPRCNDCKRPAGHNKNQCRQLEKQKKYAAETQKSSGSNNSSPTNSKFNTNNKHHETNDKHDRKHRTVYSPCETCGQTNHPTRRCYFGANAANRPSLRNHRPAGQSQVQQNDTQKDTNEGVRHAAQPFNYTCNLFTPEL